MHSKVFEGGGLKCGSYCEMLKNGEEMNRGMNIWVDI